MTISTQHVRRAAGLALTILMAGFSGGCGGGQEAPPAGAPAVASSPQTAPSEGASGTVPPLVDSRGHAASSMGEGSGGAGGALTWTVPKGWVSEAPSSSMRKAQYSLPAAPGDAEAGECAVFYFGPGQGGDIQSNVNRWASQLTSPSGGHPTPDISETTVAGRKVLKVSMEGTYNASTMMGGDATPRPGTVLLGAIVEGPDANWFFKCTGPGKTMEAHRKEFDALIDSVHSE